MAYVTPEYVRNLQKTHDCKFWRVYDSGGKVLINKCDSDIGISQSCDMLQDTIENCIGDSVSVRLFANKPTKSEEGTPRENGLSLRVKLPNGGSSIGRIPQQNFQNYNSPSLEQYISLHDKIRQVEMEKLKMELEAESQDSPWTRLGEKLLQNETLVAALTGLIMNLGAPKVAQPARVEAPSDIDETLNRLSQVDPDYKNTLAKMTSYLEKNPGVIDQIKPIFNG
jgi:hypothetical protein